MVDMKQLDVQYLADQAGEKTAVILSLATFQDLIEDLEDLAMVAERCNEPAISHSQLLSELK